MKRENASSQTEKAGQDNHDRQKTENKPKSHKPTVRNILVLGKTGVGKTYLAQCLAEEMFGSKDAIIRPP